MKASGTGQGGIWHLAIAGLLKDQGIDPNALPWVPSNGAAPGLQDMVAGGVEVVPCSIPEARSMIDAGKVRALAIMDANPPALYPNVPTLKKELGTNWQPTPAVAVPAATLDPGVGRERADRLPNEPLSVFERRGLR